MWSLLVFFVFNAFADEMSMERYCFSSSQELMQAQKSFSTIQVPSDTVAQDGNCLNIQMRPHRRELIQKFILSVAPGAKIPFSSEDAPRNTCRLKIEKQGQKKSQDSNLGWNKGPQLNQTNSHSQAMEVMQIETIKDFGLIYDQEEIKGTCRYITPERYEISLSVRTFIRPTLNNQIRQPDQTSFLLQTQVQLQRGERLDIGSVVKNLKDKNHQVDLSPKIEMRTANQNEIQKVFLSFQ